MASKQNTVMVCLVRCGETTWAHDGRMAGAADLPLSTNGRASVVADIERLATCKATTVYHPADEAAASTASVFANHLNIKRRAVAELADPDLGMFEGLTESEVKSRYPRRGKQWREDPLRLNPPEGEPILDARARLFRSISRTLRRRRSQEVAFVLHPLAIGLLQCWMADRPTSELWTTVKKRPRIERYAVAVPLIDELEQLSTVASQTVRGP